MTRPLHPNTHASQCGCMQPATPCRAALAAMTQPATPAGLGFVPFPDPSGDSGLQNFFGDWKNIALIAAGALLLWFAMNSTGAAVERRVRRRKVRAEYKAALARIAKES